MIDQLIAVLNQEIDLSAEEIADTLWLAMHMEQSGVDSVSRKSQKSQPDSENIEDNSSHQTKLDLADESPTETSTTEQKSTEKEPKSDRAGLYNQKPDQTQKSLDIPLKVPDAPSLREQLDLARALRPLMRRIPSGSTLVLDEAATTQRIANEGIWLPVIKPTLEPWLDLELVVDEGISMQIWRNTIKELERLLKNYGIFRDVRAWGLISNEQNKIQIRRGIGATAKNQSLRSTAELIDSSGRRLVLVVSDCVSDLWRSGAVNLALKTWANNVPTAIIQMLPQWLWSRTALGRATEVRFQGLAPSVSNRQLIANTVSLWSEIDEAMGIKVPVFTLEPERVSKWAQMLVGKGSIQASGFVFKPEVRNLEQNKPLFNLDRGELTAEQRVQAFRVTASPMARKLAGLLASAPVISLPVVRLIRETMLKESQQVHVAEVFLGGLLKPLSEIEVDTEPDYVQYGFIDGVRELLVDSVPTSSVLNVVEEVSKFVAKKIGLSLAEFAAVLKNPEKTSDRKVIEQVQPFAMVTAQIFRNLDGNYQEVAKELEQNIFVLKQDNTEMSRLSQHDSPQQQKPITEPSILVIGGAEDKVHDREILKTFLIRAGGERGNIVIIPSASREPGLIGDRYFRIFRDFGVKEISVIDVQDRFGGNDASYLNLVENCTGIFLTGGDQLRFCGLLADTPLMNRILERVRNHEITLAGTSSGAAIMGQHMIAGGSSAESPNHALVDMARGLGFIPEVLIDQHFFNRNRLARLLSAISQHPDLLGVGIDEDTCAIFEPDGTINVIGKGSVTIIDAKEMLYTNQSTITSSEPLSLHNLNINILTKGDNYDLDRYQSIPKITPNSISQNISKSQALSLYNLKVHILTKGNSIDLEQDKPIIYSDTNSNSSNKKIHNRTAILVIGGAEDKIHDREILKTFLRRAGGNDSNIAIIPSASREPTLISDRYVRVFRDLGVKEISVIDVRDRSGGNDANYLNLVENCTGIFLTGGAQLRLCGLLADTPLMNRILERVRNHEITLAGTSGGAAIMGRYMISGGSSAESPNHALVDMAIGIGFIPNVLIDQHFFNRNRLARLLSAISQHPDLLGVGIDEDTCAVFEPNGTINVIGKGSVTIIDSNFGNNNKIREVRDLKKSNNYQEDNLEILEVDS